mmetsp:Transcript_8838/g.15153  ORF Transcript_8838/g.15153 Transcript_8838/m.15153 type:complete len:204 (+) Transcript_8838:37-648(+)
MRGAKFRSEAGSDARSSQSWLSSPTLDEEDLNVKQLPAAFWELWALRYLALTLFAFSVAQLITALSPFIYLDLTNTEAKLPKADLDHASLVFCMYDFGIWSLLASSIYLCSCSNKGRTVLTIFQVFILLEFITSVSRFGGAFYILITDDNLNSARNPYWLALVHRGVNFVCSTTLIVLCFVVSRAAKIALRPAMSQLGGYRQL